MLPSSATVSFNREDARTLPVQLADRIRIAIDNGQLAEGDRLPSSRALSAQMGVARGVVENAYEQLSAEGWLDAKRGSGTYVNRIGSADRPPPRTVAPLPRFSDARTPSTPKTRLATGTPWVPARASAAWRRAWREVGNAAPASSYPDPRGESELRAAIARLLARARGFHTHTDSVVVTTGSMHGLRLALSGLPCVDRTSPPVLVHENPGYRTATTTAIRCGWSVGDVDVDADGMVTSAVASASESARAVYVTPSHQHPTGGMLPISRRIELADIARSRDLMIVEDDYDSEFRYDVAPLPTLAELAPDRTIYVGTVAKTLGAGVRVGWLVAPTEVVEEIVAIRHDTGDYPSLPVQHALASLLRDGEWDRTVRRARRLYRERDRLVAAALAPYGELRGVGAGMHTTLLVDADVAAAAASRAFDMGVDVETLAASTRSRSTLSGLIVGYGAISDDDLVHALDVLTSALDDVTGRARCSRPGH